MRADFAPATPRSDAIVRPSCFECGAATLLVGIEPDRPGYEVHTFQCPKCGNFETAIGKAAEMEGCLTSAYQNAPTTGKVQ